MPPESPLGFFREWPWPVQTIQLCWRPMWIANPKLPWEPRRLPGPHTAWSQCEGPSHGFFVWQRAPCIQLGRHRTSRRCTTFPLPSRLYFVEEYGGGCAIAVQHLRCGDPPLYEFGYQVGSDLHVSNLNAKPQRHTFPVMTCTLLPTKPMPASPFLIIARMLRKTLSFGPASSH